MTQSVRDLENTFAHALTLLRKNWIIVVPVLVLGLIGAAVHFLTVVYIFGSFSLTGDGSADAAAIPVLVMATVLIALRMFFSIWQMAIATGMAGAAWATGKTTLADLRAATAHRGGQVSLALILLFLIGFCAVILVPATYYLSLVAYVVFMLYTMAAIFIGGLNAPAAISESCRLALANMGPTIAVVALIVVIGWLGVKAGDVVSAWNDQAGFIVEALLQQIIVAYAALVVTGEYVKLRNQPIA